MGSCVSIISSRIREQGAPEAEPVRASVPDTSVLELEDLLRLGIAEAQLATVARKQRERLRHLHTARELLTSALRRCGQRDPDLCAHLLAVLLKLGEDARTVQSLLTECGGSSAVALASGVVASARGGGGGEPRALALSPKAGTDADSEHSSEHAEPTSVRLWEYDELKEGFLHNSDDEGESPGDSMAATSSPSELGADPASPVAVGAEGLDTSGKSRAASLSPVKEGDDDVLESIASPTERPREAAGASSAGGSRSSSAPPPEEPPEAQQAAPQAHRGALEGILGRLGRARGSTGANGGASDSRDTPGHQGAGGPEPAEERAETPSEPRGPLEGILGRLSRPFSGTHAAAHEPAEAACPRSAPSSSSKDAPAPTSDGGAEVVPAESPSCPSPAWSPPQCPPAADDLSSGAAPLPSEGGGGSDTREALKESIARFRAFVQPQQAGASHPGGGGGKRRQARSLGSLEAAKEGKASEPASTTQSPHVAPRHSRKQPSQSSSSGSVSDSDGSGVGRRHSTYPLNFGACPKDSGHVAVACVCGQTFTADSVFCRTCGKKRPAELPEGKARSTLASPAFVPPTRGAGGGTPVLAAADDERWLAMAGGRGQPQSHLDSPSRSHGYLSESQEAAAVRQPATMEITARTPQMPATSPALQEASPSLDSAVRNPLAQADLLFNGAMLPLRAGGGGSGGLTPKCCAASPNIGASVSCEDFSIAASCAPSMPQSLAPSAMPSPFCGGALSRPELTPPTPSALAAAGGTGAETVSVRILNGVSGEEEVRFPVPMQGNMPEQHFLSILDRQCQLRAGQPLAGLNWLSQAQSGSRFQRRKCDAAMVEELVSKRGGHDKRKTPAVLLLCTVPVRPPSELAANKVRLKNLVPAQVAVRTGAEPVRLQLDTSPLEGGHDYTVGFTHQVSNVTYNAEAVLLPNLRGVELTVPWQMLVSSNQTTEGLYDAHLVTDGAFRSENRRTLTVGSAESELSSSSVSHACSASSFIPIGKGRI